MQVAGFVLVVVLWVALGLGLLVSPDTVDSVWAWFRDQSLVVQVPLGLLLLPWVLAVWIWESSWPAVVRLVLVLGLAWATVYAFLPRRTAG